jgi:uncharacterized protein
VILLDTGPLVALFDPVDQDHPTSRAALAGIRESMVTTVPVLTETSYLLRRQSVGFQRLRQFLASTAVVVDYLDEKTLARVFVLMERYHDRPMSFADASLIAVAERLGTTRIFTLDLDDFSCYRIRRGQRDVPVSILSGRASP